MKLFDEAISIINKLEEGVGEVPPQVPSPGNVSYYQSVDEAEGEWGPWNYHKGVWDIDDSELSSWKKDPWGRPLENWKLTKAYDEVFNKEGDVSYWVLVIKSPEGKPYEISVWND